ncbi:hypothetical protein B0H66DRAFT_600211 [Apodospora peruviana]|uniref:Phosphatidylserine decarboxylase n=1 Tax=Apodospora peruviana TaxID=516989 RepID=A0AAE0IKM1_9PEZI|nr:hypothetical protein B0H66DRAFT_600211 [Apodospora peruviana]
MGIINSASHVNAGDQKMEKYSHTSPIAGDIGALHVSASRKLTSQLSEDSPVWEDPLKVDGLVGRCEKGAYCAYIIGDSSPSSLASINQPSPFQFYLLTFITLVSHLADIGLVCFIAIGMTDTSGCEMIVQPGQHVDKGEKMGIFHFGGSSDCLVFGLQAKLLWPGIPPQDSHLWPKSFSDPDNMPNFNVCSLLATGGEGK